MWNLTALVVFLLGMDQDDVVLSPYTTVMKRLLAQTYLSGIFASALTEDI